MIFRSLRIHNYRLYFIGQLVSIAGTWMQAIALDWLVLRLSNSGVAVGMNAALQFGPMLLFGTWGGLVADRIDKRRLLIAIQSLYLVQALGLGTLAAGGWAKLWMVYALSTIYGVIQVADIPARHSFVPELVGPEDVMNAVSLNSAVFNVGRIVGPAIAGVLIATSGLAVCFFVNAASFVAIIVALALMRPAQFHGERRTTERGKGQIRAGLRYVVQTRELFLTLLLMAVIGTFGLNFRTILPLLTRFTFHEGAHTYGVLASSLSIGSLAGALLAASRRTPSRRMLVWSAIAFGVTAIIPAFAPTVTAEYFLLPLLGFTSMVFVSTANSLLQLNTSAEMRGRVLALYGLVLMGSTPIGGPIMGWVSQHWSPRVALATAGILCVIGSIPVGIAMLRHRRMTLREPAGWFGVASEPPA